MEKDLIVKFPIEKNWETGMITEYGKGRIVDRFLGLTAINQEAPSGEGGSLTLQRFKINIDYYLILGENDETYNVPCSEVLIFIPEK